MLKKINKKDLWGGGGDENSGTNEWVNLLLFSPPHFNNRGAWRKKYIPKAIFT